MLVAFALAGSPGDRALLAVAEAAIRTGACASLLLAPSRQPDTSLLERGRWALGGLTCGIVAAELVSVTASTLAISWLACLLLGVWVWLAASPMQPRRLADELREESA